MIKKFLKRLFSEANLNIINHIFFINLLQAFPENRLKNLEHYKYQLDYHKLYRGILLKNMGLSTLFLLVVYTLLFMVFPFKLMPIFLDMCVLSFALLTLLVNFPYFFNIFYESNDLKHYLALPISEVTVFRSKMIVLLSLMIQSTLPLFVLITIFLTQQEGLSFLPIALIQGFLYFLLLTGLLFLLCLLLMQGMVRILRKKNIRTGILTLINSSAIFLNLALILGIQQMMKYFEANTTNLGEPSFGPFSFLLSQPILRSIFVIIALVILFWGLRLFSQNANGRFYQFYQKLEEVPQETRKSSPDFQKTKRLSTRNVFLRYQLSLMDDSSLITQSLISPLIIPLIIFIPNIIKIPQETLQNIIRVSPILPLLTLAMGIALFINIMPTSLSALIFSLERANFSYLKALPLSFTRLFFMKSMLATVMNSILPIILLTLAALYLNLSLITLLLAIIFLLVLMLSFSWNWQIYDLKHLNLNWSNISDLYARSSRMVMFFSLFIGIFLSMAVFTAFFYYLDHIGKLYLLTPILVTIATLIFIFSAIRAALFLKNKSYH